MYEMQGPHWPDTAPTCRFLSRLRPPSPTTHVAVTAQDPVPRTSCDPLELPPEWPAVKRCLN